MRDVYIEYKQGLITWKEAYFIANNIAATASSNADLPFEETEYWCKQMESLAVDAAEYMMITKYGYMQNADGVFYKHEHL